MTDRIYKGFYKFWSLVFVASFVVMQTGGCELPGSNKPEFTKEIVTITAPLIEEKTEEKIKEETGETGNSETGKALTSETGNETSECVCTKWKK